MSNFLKNSKRATTSVKRNGISCIPHPNARVTQKHNEKNFREISSLFLFLMVIFFLIFSSSLNKAPKFSSENPNLDFGLVISVLNSWFGNIVTFITHAGSAMFLTTFQILVQKIIEPAAWIISIDMLFITAVGFVIYNFGICKQNVGGVNTNLEKSNNLKHEISNFDDCGESSKQLPKVLVQLPMYNELLVYERSIARACALNYPKNLLYVQVLDDSTMDELSLQMEECVREWRGKGMNIFYRHRKNRVGFKAGNLKEGLCEAYAKKCDFVAILDADFEPSPDWLIKAITPLLNDPSLVLTQTRWTFSNSNECLLTKCQEIELKWHFLAEQLTSSYLFHFFGFNGSGGVWRTSAIWESGNWKDDTTVEDMDMAICSTLKGFKFQLLPHVECLSELPSTWKAYRKQQHRWTCGPASLLRLRFYSVLASSSINFFLKTYILGVYIALRRGLKNVINLCLCFILPLWLLFPSLLSHRPPYALLSWIFIHPICLFVFSPQSIAFLPIYSFLMNTMALLRFQALISGLMNFSSSKTWDVTFKTGKNKSQNQMQSQNQSSHREDESQSASPSSPLIDSTPSAEMGINHCSSFHFAKSMYSSSLNDDSDLKKDAVDLSSPLSSPTLSPSSSLSLSSSPSSVSLSSSPSSPRSPLPTPSSTLPCSSPKQSTSSPSSLPKDCHQVNQMENKNKKETTFSVFSHLSFEYEILIGLLLLSCFFLYKFGDGLQFFIEPASLYGVIFSFWICIQGIVFVVAGLGYLGLNGV